ncbi:MAG: oxidoreductase, partial [Thermoleophilia bacterium]|nr:oxidoreductase [Thermoleophilia bacterium]
SEPGAWPRFYERLVAAIGGEGPLPVDPWDAVAVLEILERARG